MELSFVDTNLFIRYITQDNPDQAQKAQRIFHQIKTGARIVTSSEAVISECVYVLSSKALYHLPRERIVAALTILLSLNGFKLPRKRTCLRALSLYASSTLDFVDALIVAQMEHAKIPTLLSFDQGFDRVQGITRRES